MCVCVCEVCVCEGVCEGVCVCVCVCASVCVCECVCVCVGGELIHIYYLSRSKTLSNKYSHASVKHE